MVLGSSAIKNKTKNNYYILRIKVLKLLNYLNFDTCFISPFCLMVNVNLSLLVRLIFYILNFDLETTFKLK